MQSAKIINKVITFLQIFKTEETQLRNAKFLVEFLVFLLEFIRSKFLTTLFMLDVHNRSNHLALSCLVLQIVAEIQRATKTFKRFTMTSLPTTVAWICRGFVDVMRRTM